jgi:hypothetical protein
VALNVVRALNVSGHPHFGQGEGSGSLMRDDPFRISMPVPCHAFRQVTDGRPIEDEFRKLLGALPESGAN